MIGPSITNFLLGIVLIPIYTRALMLLTLQIDTIWGRFGKIDRLASVLGSILFLVSIVKINISIFIRKYGRKTKRINLIIYLIINTIIHIAPTVIYLLILRKMYP